MLKMKRIELFLVAVALWIAASCSVTDRPDEFFDVRSDVAIPCNVTGDTTLVIVRDYFPMIGNVKSVKSEDFKIVNLSKCDMDTVLAISTPSTRKISLLEVYGESGKGTIVMKNIVSYGKGAPALATVKSLNNGKGVLVKAQNIPANYIVLWQNSPVDPSSIVRKGDGEFLVKVPSYAKEMEKSYIRIYSYNNVGCSNDILIPLLRGRVINDASLLGREDYHTWMMYQIMIDRFWNGNPTNDWKIASKDVLPKVDYFGGDIAGIDQKLLDGYFDRLGMNTIWISPISCNPYTAWGLNKDPYTKFSGYHGYWPVTQTTIDPRFATEEELHKLITDVHNADKSIILDYVANHVHLESAVYREHPDWVTPAVTPDGRPNFELWDDFRLTTWFDKHIPTLDLEREEVNEPMTDSAMVWVEKFDFDGIRHDATKHIPEVFWRKLTGKMLSRLPEKRLFQIGETYGSPELISSYVKSGMLSCQFDFNLYDSFVGEVTSPKGSFVNLSNTISSSLNTYGYHNLMGIISGNHDRPRFVSLAGGDLLPGEDTKLAGWKRKIGVTDSTAFDKLIMLHTMNFTLPGIPCIYMGDEYGQPGGNDPDNRRQAQFEPKCAAEKRVVERVSSLAHSRSASMPLIYGDLYELYSDADLLIYMRIYMGEYVITALNKSERQVDKLIELPFGLEYQGNSKMVLQLDPLGSITIFSEDK